MDPFTIPRFIYLWVSFWWGFWSRKIGRKWLIALTVCSFFVTVWLNYRY